MQNKGEGPMFYKVDDTTFSIPAGKCWLTLPNELKKSPMLRFGDTTGIDNVTVRNNAGSPDSYDLQGRKARNAINGIYIVNGKKIIK